MLYEMLAGERPFAGGFVDEEADRLRRRLPRLAGSTADEESGGPGRCEPRERFSLACSLFVLPASTTK